MKPPVCLRYLFACIVLWCVIPAQAQSSYRLLVHDAYNNSYARYNWKQQYIIVTTDSLIISGYITGFNKTSFFFEVYDSTHIIRFDEVVNMGYGPGRKTGEASPAGGVVLCTIGGLCTIASLSTLGSDEISTAIVYGVLGVGSIAGGILLLKPSALKKRASSRTFITKPRYSFRVVESTL